MWPLMISPKVRSVLVCPTLIAWKRHRDLARLQADRGVTSERAIDAGEASSDAPVQCEGGSPASGHARHVVEHSRDTNGATVVATLYTGPIMLPRAGWGRAGQGKYMQWTTA